VLLLRRLDVNVAGQECWSTLRQCGRRLRGHHSLLQQASAAELGTSAPGGGRISQLL